MRRFAPPVPAFSAASGVSGSTKALPLLVFLLAATPAFAQGGGGGPIGGLFTKVLTLMQTYSIPLATIAVCISACLIMFGAETMPRSIPRVVFGATMLLSVSAFLTWLS